MFAQIYYKRCRLCAYIMEKLIPIEAELIERIKLLFQEKIGFDDNDNIPRNVCLYCLDSINNAWSFFKRITQAQREFSELLTKTDSFANPDWTKRKLKPCKNAELENIVIFKEISIIPIERSLEYYGERYIHEDHSINFMISSDNKTKVPLQCSLLAPFKNVELEASSSKIISRPSQGSLILPELDFSNSSEKSSNVTEVLKDSADSSKSPHRIPVGLLEHKPNLKSRTKASTNRHSFGIKKKKSKFRTKRIKRKDGRANISSKHRNEKVVKTSENSDKHIEDYHLDPEDIWPDYPWICNVCTEKCTDIEDYKKHSCFQLHKRFFCADCPKTLVRTDQFFKHISEVHCERFYKHQLLQCDECQMWFPTLMAQEEHRGSEHPNAPPRPPLPESSRKNLYHCDHCNKDYKTRSQLTNHLKMHSKDKPHTCDVCGKAYFYPSSLLEHKKLHNKSRDFICEQCGRGFYNKGTLKAHKQTHLDISDRELPFACSYCNKRFANRCKLRYHEMVHTGAKPFICDICGRNFRLRDSLKGHVTIVHSDEKTHSCSCCETWLNCRIPDSIIAIPGYSLHRSDRAVTRGGGICIYVSNDFGPWDITPLVSRIPQYCTGEVESLWLEITLQSTKLNLVIVYRPPSYTVEQDKPLLEALTRASSNLSNLIVFGDFNYPSIDWTNVHNMIARMSPAGEFVKMYLDANLHQRINFPTRFRGQQSANTLDLIFENEPNLISEITSDEPMGSSDHVTIIASMQITINPRARKANILYRNYKHVDFEVFGQRVVEKLPPDDVLEASDIQYDYDALLNAINTTLDHMIPLRTLCKRTRHPWITTKLRNLIKQKYKLWQQYRFNQTDNAYDLYRVAANVVKSKLRSAHRTYIQTIQDKGTRYLYKHVSSVLTSKMQEITLTNPASTALTNNCQIVADILAHEFSTNFSAIAGHHGTLPEQTNSHNCLTELTFSLQDVSKALSDLKEIGSSGPDGIPKKVLKHCASQLAPYIFNLYKKSLNTGNLPSQWKSAYVVPVYKKGDKLCPSHYRPISITSPVCKILERILTTNITKFITSEEIIPPSQHGFTQGRSTVTNLLTCLGDWTTSVDDNQPIDVIYIDFAKAFDSVDFEALTYKLHFYGIRGKILEWLTNFLNKRTFMVKIKNKFSAPMTINSGVVQGSVIGPILFNIFIADLESVVSSTVVSFADDTKLYNNPLHHHHIIQRDLDALAHWCKTWKMTINVSKFVILHIGKNNPKHQYLIDNSPIVAVSDVRDLGVTITNTLKWDAHIVNIVKSANTISYLLRKAFPNSHCDTSLQLFKTFVRPRLEYAAVIWSPYYVKDICLVESAQRSATKRFKGLRNWSYDNRLKKLNLLSLETRRSRGDLIETYKWLKGHYNSTKDLYLLAGSTHLRGHSLKLETRRARTLVKQKFLPNRIVTLWNKLTDSDINSPSIAAFKAKLDKLSMLQPGYNRL